MKHSESEQVEAGSAIHLALDELEPVDLAFDVALTPWQSEGLAHGIDVPFEACGEALQGGTSCGFKPCWQRLQAAFAEDAEEACSKLRDFTDLG